MKFIGWLALIFDLRPIEGFNKNLNTCFVLVQGPTEKEQIDVQGDIMYDIVEFITDTWKSVSDSLYPRGSTQCSCWFAV